MLKELANYDEEVLQPKDAVLKVYGAHCGPCKMLVPVIEHIADANPSTPIYEIEGSSNYDLMTKLGIVSVPTVIFYKDGVERERIVGLNPQEKYQSAIDKLT